MLRLPRLEGIGINKRDFTLVFTLLFNVLTWSYLIMKTMSSLAFDLSFIYSFQAIFAIATLGSGMAGSFLSEKIGRMRLLYWWLVLGLVSSGLLALASNAASAYFSMLYIVLGIAFGIGMPSCLAYLADHTHVENRGRVSAIIFLASNLAVAPFALMFTEFSLTMGAMVIMAWRGLGLLVFVLLKRPDEEKKMSEPSKNQSFGKVVHDRSFTLYLFPWFMFNLIDIFERPILNRIGAEFLEFSKMVEPLVAILSIMLGGLLADRIGRKRVVIYGFVSLGVAYAVIGLANQNPLSWYFYMLIDGVAYGILWLIFLLVMWGDLSEHGIREKYYVIGTTPFLIAPVLPVIMAPLSTMVEAGGVLSLASFFLFLAVLPLMYAPETLPEKKIELRRLRGYLEQAKKLKDKYPGK